jgi:hypothetical protein
MRLVAHLTLVQLGYFFVKLRAATFYQQHPQARIEQAYSTRKARRTRADDTDIGFKRGFGDERKIQIHTRLAEQPHALKIYFLLKACL